MVGKTKKRKKRLLAEREQTLAKLRHLRSYVEIGEERSSGSEDSVDAAVYVHEREKTLAIIQTLEKKLVSIDRALRAAEKGNYGICEICGQAIDPGRLEVMPYVTACIRCQEKLERFPRRWPLATSLRKEQ